ncbi:hypothetical protein HNW13_017430 [Shewanella sp. BF02_Schw]|uniref:hypothetical protein n=1 Tax=Shewanella sp. BF02_Schw TaxID=394908 RepID=UPI00178576A1|nr:hypothetical protein [Shewanella sp. BF02_Schw]MBO1897521.1 hypothetical protein [Shewanella sp. BF02_Schw]
MKNTARLDLITSTEYLQLPNKQKTTTKSVEKPLDKTLLNAIPQNIGTLKIAGTIYIPIILVALVLRKAKGFDTSCASDLTKVINDHIVININRPKIATNNMSRELRKDNILDLDWLSFQKNGRNPLFSLNDNWKKNWKLYFGKLAPKL